MIHPVVWSGPFIPLSASLAAARVGTTTNDNAAAGQIGEFISSTVGATALVTDTVTNITSLALTAGDWDVVGSIQYAPAGTTTVTKLFAAISLVSATLPGVAQSETRLNLPFTTGQLQTVGTPTLRVSIAAPTTVYLVGFSSFAVATMNTLATFRARRVR